MFILVVFVDKISQKASTKSSHKCILHLCGKISGDIKTFDDVMSRKAKHVMTEDIL